MNRKFYQSTILLFALLISTAIFAQSPEAANQTHGHDEEGHISCATDRQMELLLQERPGLRTYMENYYNNLLPTISKRKSQSNDKTRGPETIYIPIVFHVIHNAGEAVGQGQNLSEDRINLQMEFLNADFAQLNDDYEDTPDRFKMFGGNPDIQFCLASVDPDGNPTNGITRTVDQVTGTGSDEPNQNNIRDIKERTGWPTDEYYNVWVLPIPGGSVAGYAYLPTFVTPPFYDGTVMDYRSIGANSVLTHECGHYLGLYHTFEGGCSAQNDGISDTAPQRIATSSAGSPNCRNGYPAGPATCSGQEHQYVNYMDYSPGICKTMFSQGQVNVMRSVALGVNVLNGFRSRAYLMNNAPNVCTFYDNDASMAQILLPQFSICADDPTYTPEIRITNLGQLSLTEVTITQVLDGGAPIDFVHTTNLVSGESETITLPAQPTPAPGLHDLVIYTRLPNGVADEQPFNDTLSTSFEVFTKEIWTDAIHEDFTYANVDADPILQSMPSGLRNSGSGSRWFYLGMDLVDE